MSTLWTPEGERPVNRGGDRSAPGARAPSGSARPAAPSAAGEGSSGPTGEELGEQDQEALAAQLEQVRRQLLETPAQIVVANHAYGLFELAAIHLSEHPPNLEEGRLAVDGLGARVEGLAGRLGEAEQPLKDALAQIRLAFVQISDVGSPGSPPGGSTSASTGGEENPGTKRLSG